MYRIASCPCCGSDVCERWPVLISPFVVEYALNGKRQNCALLSCSLCQFKFYDLRYDPQEVQRLYTDYRGERYFETRHKYEFWYTKAMNDGIGGDAREIQYRKQNLYEFLKGYTDTGGIRSVLDYGGDRGQFIPDDIGAERFVYDVSNVDPIASVVRLASAEAVNARCYDLVMVCHVLEHMSDPGGGLRAVMPVLAEKSFLYVEVPFEQFDISFVGRGAWYRRYLNAVARCNKVATLIDFISTACRRKLKFIPPFGFAKMHEHINFFTASSLRALLEKNGFSVVACEVRNSPTYAGFEKVISALAKVSPDEAF